MLNISTTNSLKIKLIENVIVKRLLQYINLDKLKSKKGTQIAYKIDLS